MIEKKDPVCVPWNILNKEIKQWCSRVEISGLVCAAAAYICHLVHTKCNIDYSRELAGAASVYALKMYSDATISLIDVVNTYSNTIVIDYENKIFELLCIQGECIKMRDMYFSIVQDMYMDCSNSVAVEVNNLIMKSISEDVWCLDQTKITDSISTYIESIVKDKQIDRKYRKRSRTI